MKMRMPMCLAAAALAAFLTFSASGVTSSPTRGTLHGVVTDPSGAVIAGASVIAWNDQFALRAHTDMTGQFAISGLPPAHYNVAVQAEGFALSEKTGLRVLPDSTTEADTQLAIHPLQQEITVTSR